MNREVQFQTGLASGLRYLERRQYSGMLRARLTRHPLAHGQCQVYCLIENGQVIRCMIEEEQSGRTYPASISLLSRLANEKETTDLVFHPQPSVKMGENQLSDNYFAPSVFNLVSSAQYNLDSIPQRIDRPRFEQLSSHPFRERAVIRLVFNLIDGCHSVRDLHSLVAFSEEEVNDALQALLHMGVIRLQ